MIVRRFGGKDTTAEQEATNLEYSACRQCIEWNYGHLKQMFSYFDYAHGLKLQRQQVAAMFLVAMALRNAFVTMNGISHLITTGCNLLASRNG